MNLKLSAARRIIVASLLALCSQNVPAWGPLGHQVIATLAQQQLQPRAREEVARLLALEPGATLASLSNWADEHRDATTARWHYVNLPRGTCAYDEARDCPGGDCVVRAIADQFAVLKSPAADLQRLQALKYLVHLVADLHQPLHAGFGDDRGGNQYQINTKGKGTNLHAIWDFDVVVHVGKNVDAWMRKLTTMPAPVSTTPFDPAQAARESCDIVSGKGFYPPHTLPDEYLDRNAATAVTRMQLAGYRLASLLNAAWP